MTKAKKPTLPANLAFLRSVEPTTGVMQSAVFSGAPSIEAVLNGDGVTLRPVEITATTVRGTIANDHKDAPEKRVGTGEKSLNAANIATVEQAVLPIDSSHLVVSTAVRFSGHSRAPSMCNLASFRESIEKLTASYGAKGGYAVLALRYMLQLANGSWLWRNRYGQDMQVGLKLGDAVVALTEADIDMSKGWTVDAVAASQRDVFQGMVDQVAKALAGDRIVMVEAVGLVELGAGAEVYPSQEFASSSSTKVVAGKEADKVTKVLSKQRLSNGIWAGTIHARKIGNAIRTIDTWHGRPGVGALAVEPYGANTFQGEAHRVHKNDLYTYLRDPDTLTEEVESHGISDVHHFVVACLIRGGVYGFAEAAKAKGGDADANEGDA